MNKADIVNRAFAYSRAWSSGDPYAVAAYFAENGTITVNGGPASTGRGEIAEMAAGFFADFPDLHVQCDDFRIAGDHVLFVWTLEGHHSGTGRYVRTRGWEEWDLDSTGHVARSRGWFDADGYNSQIEGKA